jgi:hypothetical protein
VTRDGARGMNAKDAEKDAEKGVEDSETEVAGMRE